MIKIQLLEVWYPGIDIYVKYKVLDPLDVELFATDHQDLPPEDYIRKVLELCVFNLKTDVTQALKKLDRDVARAFIDNVYNGCMMLNPGFDVEAWLKLASREEQVGEGADKSAGKVAKAAPKKTTKARKITKPRFLGLETHLKSKIIGQDQAIEEVCSALKRQVAGLGDENRPLGVFLFAGASGVGKTALAKELHNYLFGENDIVRIDCGEYQHKHENQKLLGAPPGYLGHENGGHLTNQVSDRPNTVVLLDEVEKAHNDVWDTFLRVFDDGYITDSAGNQVSFRNAIIIMTTNLGNAETVDMMINGGLGFARKTDSDPEIPRRELVENYAKRAIRKVFRPEFLNRIDKTVIFNHLTNDNLVEIARLECEAIEEKLARRGMLLNYGDDVLDAMIAEGVNPVEGARGLQRIRREKIENAISDRLLASQRWPRGTVITLSWSEENGYEVEAKRPKRSVATS